VTMRTSLPGSRAVFSRRGVSARMSTKGLRWLAWSWSWNEEGVSGCFRPHKNYEYDHG
jgi:hypothetical protein